MGKIIDFPCSYGNSSGVRPEVTEGLGLTFPDAYLHSETMVKLARSLKEKDNAVHCDLSFCHTLEAEAMGGDINLGNDRQGPRCGGYVCSSVEQLLELPDIDFSKGRIAETLEAARTLCEQGEYPNMELCGPFTIMANLIDLKYVFKACRRQPEIMKEVYWKFGRQTLKFIKEAEAHGMKLISYADPTGALNILGPKVLESYTNEFTADFIRQAVEETREDTMILLCPKTTYALIGTDNAEFVEHQLPEKKMRYADACISMVGQVKLSGQNCIKNVGFNITNGIFMEVKLK